MAAAVQEPKSTRCPWCGSTRIGVVESSLTDDELLECESCLRAYEVKRGPDDAVTLLAV
jgi:hypothetical protein